jgi:DNA excision repair protein ERCC-5
LILKYPQNPNVGSQGVLDKYFDTSIAGGIYAPRKRKAYASKRLQQVVSDFRKGVVEERAKSATPKEATPTFDEARGSRGGRKRTRGSAKAITTPRKKRKLRSPSPADEEMESEDDGVDSSAVSDRPLSVSLRPRRNTSTVIIDEEK